MGSRIKYRSKIDIFASILEIASKENNTGITRLMYGSLLSYPQIRSYLVPLLKGNLLICHYKSYSITERGRKFLELYSELVKIVNLEP